MCNHSDIGVLFDLDGVLIDSEQKYSQLWRNIDKEFPTGIPHFERVIKGTTLPDILQRYFPNENIRRQVELRCIDGESNMTYEMTPGAIVLLETLKLRKIPAAMVTSSDNVKMRHLWTILPNLRNYFSTVIASEDVTRSKPDPEGYLKAAERIGVAPQRCIVVEDSVQGVKAGKAAGAFVVGMTETMGRMAIERVADTVLDSLEDFELDKYIEIILSKENR